MNGSSYIDMSYENPSSQINVNRNSAPIYKRDITYNDNNKLFDADIQKPEARSEPHLNIVQGSQVPNVGLDLIMNQKTTKGGYSSPTNHKNKHYNSPSASASGDDQNSNLFDDDDSNFSSEAASSVARSRNRDRQVPQKKKSYFVNNDDDESEASGDYGSEDEYETEPKHLSEDDILNEKKELLYQFDRLEKRGVRVPKRYSINSDLDEMKADYEKLKREREVDNSIAFQKKMLMGFTTGLEYLNTRFDPFDVHLEGWSDSIADDLNSYEDVFEELHTKYRGKSSMSPEIRLILSVGGSAVYFHLANSMFKNTKVPGLEEVLRSNPGLMKQVSQAAMASMGSGGNQQAASFNNFFQGMQQQPQQQQQQQPRTHMKGPTNIEDILNDLEGDELDEKLEGMSEITDSSDDMSLNDLLTSKKSKKNKKRSTMRI